MNEAVSRELKIGVVGTGYVGLVTGTCFAELGLNVTCMDNDSDKIDRLQKGILPIYEPGLEQLVKKNVASGRLTFTQRMEDAVQKSSAVFIAVGTPPREDGSADLQYVTEVACNIAAYLQEYTVIVNKSTVPVGTGKRVKAIIQERLDLRGAKVDFDVVSNPEFLREGLAINDFMYPDRIVLGAESQKATDIMKQIYGHINTKEFPIICTSIESSELIKYASNAFLAMKISYINQIAELCERVDANILDVAKGIGLDKRIGPHTLQAGPGFGGSCFPKDTRALIKIGNEAGVDISLIRNVIDVNDAQRVRLADRVKESMGAADGKTIAVLGLVFKPNTDDMRESAAIPILSMLKEAGFTIRAYDPQGMENARTYYLQDIDLYYASDVYDALMGADAVMILTEWEEFGQLDFDRMKKVGNVRYFFDYRNMYDRDVVEKNGIWYAGVGV